MHLICCLLKQNLELVKLLTQLKLLAYKVIDYNTTLHWIQSKTIKCSYIYEIISTCYHQ